MRALFERAGSHPLHGETDRTAKSKVNQAKEGHALQYLYRHCSESEDFREVIDQDDAEESMGSFLKSIRHMQSTLKHESIQIRVR